MRLRPSGLSLRLRVGAAAGAAAAGFLLPFGRPRPLRAAGAVVPGSKARACCSFDIWASISAIIRLTSTCYLQLRNDKSSRSVSAPTECITRHLRRYRSNYHLANKMEVNQLFHLDRSNLIFCFFWAGLWRANQIAGAGFAQGL